MLLGLDVISQVVIAEIFIGIFCLALEIGNVGYSYDQEQVAYPDEVGEAEAYSGAVEANGAE